MTEFEAGFALGQKWAKRTCELFVFEASSLIVGDDPTSEFQRQTIASIAEALERFELDNPAAQLEAALAKYGGARP